MSALLVLVMLTLLAVSVGVNLYLMRKSRRHTENKSSSVLLQGIQDVNELATIRQSFQSIVIYEDSRRLCGLNVPGTSKKFILKYSGNIVVGTDLSKAEITQFVSGRVTVTIPRSRVIEVHADMDSVRIYDQRAGIFASLEFDEQNRSIAENLKEIKDEADAGDLKKMSDKNAKSVLESLARSMGISAKVEFFDENATASAPTALSVVADESEQDVLMPAGEDEKILVLS